MLSVGNVSKNLNRTISISNELLLASNGLLTLGVVIANVKVKKINSELWDVLQKAGESSKKYKISDIDKIPQIKAVRDTYKNLGLKVSDYKGSNEALLRRVLTDKGLYQINTVVDVNNYISINSLRSVGSYDLSKLNGDIIFRKGADGETYIGTTNRPFRLKNLSVLSDENGPFGSPTSDSKRALIQEETTNVMTVIFSFDGDSDLIEQTRMTGELFMKYADATNVNYYIVKDAPQDINCTLDSSSTLQSYASQINEKNESIDLINALNIDDKSEAKEEKLDSISSLKI